MDVVDVYEGSAENSLADAGLLKLNKIDNEFFFDCPTAIPSIISSQSSLDRYKLDSGSLREFSSIDNPSSQSVNQPDSIEEGGVRRVSGGYFGGFHSKRAEGTPVLSEVPIHLIDKDTLEREACRAKEEGELDPLNVVNPSNAVNPLNVVNPLSVVSMEPIKMEPVGRVSPANLVEPIRVPNVAEPVSVTASPVLRGCGRTTGEVREMSYLAEGFEMVPRFRPVEFIEKHVEVPVVHHVDTFVPKHELREVESVVRKPYTEYVEEIVEVPEIHYNDRIVEVPEVHEITKTVEKLEVKEHQKFVPKIEVREVPKYVEVPVVQYVDKFQEFEEVEEVVKHVEKIQVVKVPREVVKKVVKKVPKVIERERIVPIVEYRDVPVEKLRYVPKIETVEILREIPKVVDVEVPYQVEKLEVVDEPYEVITYKDVPVAVPVCKRVKQVYTSNGKTEYVDVPVHRPYFVIHDHINFKVSDEPSTEHLKVVGYSKVDVASLSPEERE